jgi:cellulose synthase/poly-beta-1,6-N-acetylglucosamine synthase-like glycosyltransferase
LSTTAPPLVSVVIPCFNQAQFLSDAIESVLAQTYGRVELIVVDDGSSDNTAAVAGRFGEVVYRWQENAGPPSARNNGLRESRGELIAFLDSDDRLLPEALEVGVSALQANPECAAAVGACRNIDAGGRPLDVPAQPLVLKDHYLALLKSCFILSGSSVLFRRSALHEIDGFDRGLALGDDYDLYLRTARLHPICCHGRVVTEYRRHSGSLTRDPVATLRGELRALRRQRGMVRGSRESSARRAGIRRARRTHGDELSEHLLEEVQRRRWGRAASTCLALLRAYPRALLASLDGVWRSWRLGSAVG